MDTYKPFQCEVCSEFFWRKGEMTKHKRIHTGEKPYECDICDKTFSQSANLGTLKRIHTGKKAYTCNICEKTFSRNSSLAIHTRIHTGEKPYSCDLCQQSFAHRSALAQHNKRASHLKRKESLNLSSSTSHTDFIDCGEVVKVEDIKEEIKEEEESVDDPLSIQGETTKGVNENIVTGVKEEVMDDT